MLKRGLLLLVLLATADMGACQSRHRMARQEDGEFWWLKKNEDEATIEKQTANIDGRNSQNIQINFLKFFKFGAQSPDCLKFQN